MNTKTILSLLENVIYIEDKTSLIKDIYPTFTVILNNSVWNLQYNGIEPNKYKQYHICYRCLTCQRKCTIGLTHMTKKINKDSRVCESCHMYKTPMKSIKNEVDWSSTIFDQLTSLQRNEYFQEHLTESEYHIIMGDFEETLDVVYVPAFKMKNKFVPVLYNTKNDTIEIFRAIRGYCRKCGFHSHLTNIKVLKEMATIPCKTCSIFP